MGSEDEYRKYRSNLGELATKAVLERLSDLWLEKIPEKKNDITPDFRVLKEAIPVATCEVKSLVDPLFSSSSDFNFGTQEWNDLMKKKDANHRSKLRKKLGEGINQLKKYKGSVTVICFVSFDMTDYIDMGQVLQEHLELHPGDWIPDVFILMKVHQNIIPSNNFEIEDTIRLMHNSKQGEEFGTKYLAWDQTLKKTGSLPLSFTLEN